MTTAYTSLLGLALPVTGELSGTWGDTVNTAITSLLDTAVAGTTSITTDADITLSTTTGASNQARQAIILWNPASGTTTRNITAPAQSKMYTVINASGGTQSIVIRGAGPTTGVTIIKGESALVAWNGSDFVKVSSVGGSATLIDLTVTGNTILGDAAADTLTVNATSTFNAPVSFAGQVRLPSTGRSAAAALTPTNPAFLYGVASTYTDTASSGTLAPVASFYGLAQPTLSTSNVTTYTTAATLYIANAPAAGGSATITNPYALYVNSGASYLAGVLGVGGVTTLGNNLLFGTDNTYDIGPSGANRPRNLFVANKASVGTTGNTYGLTVGGGLHIVNAATLASAQGSMVLTFDNPYNRIIMGDGSGYSFTLSTRVASTTTDLLTLNDNGTLGLGGAPISTVRQYIKGAGATSATWSLYIDDSAASNIFFVRNDGAAYHSGNTGIGITNTFGARLAVLGGALPTSSVGVAISSTLTAGRLTSGDTNSATAYIGQYLDTSITEVSAGSSGALTSGIVTFGGSAAVNPNTVRTYTGGAVRTIASSGGLEVVGAVAASYSTGAGILQLGTSAGRAQFQYITFGGNTGGTDYGWQIGRSSTAGIIADGFYIYDIKSNATRLAIDLIGAVKIGSSNGTTAGNLLVLGNGNNTAGVAVINTANANRVGLTISNWDGTATTFGPRLAFDNSGRAGWVMGGADGSAAFDICFTTWGVPTLRLESGIATVKGGGSVSSYLMSTNAGNVNNQIVSFYNNGAAYANLIIDGAVVVFNTSGVPRGNFGTNGLFSATYGSFSETSLGSVTGSNGFQIQQSSTYNDGVAHSFSPFQDVTGILYIRATGLSAIPFYPNGGGGIAYGWTVLNPQTGVWSVAQGPTVNFTEFSSSPNSYSVVFSGGGGSVSITRTAGTTPYTVSVQRFGTV